MKKLISFLALFLIAASFGSIAANAVETKTKYAGESVTNENNNQLDEKDNDSLPETYSSVDLGYCTSVKSQVGDTCWAYSALASFETALLKDGLFTSGLNVDALDDWGSLHDELHGWQRALRESGSTYIPIGNFTSWSGPVTSEDSTPRFGATEISFYGKEDLNAVKRAIMRTGAVTANFMNYRFALSKDRSSFCLTDPISYNSGHAVSVVGWDDNYDKSLFDGNYSPKNNGAWLCKNSWGENYNTIGGYLWISYEDYYLFNNEQFDPSFSVDEIRVIGEKDHLYQNEIHGATYEFKYIDSDDITYFNVFDFSEDGNVLEKVIFETLSLGAKYSIYYVPLDADEVPVTDKTKWVDLCDGIVEHNGYLSCDTKNRALPKKKGAIAVRIDTSEVTSRNCVGVSEWLRDVFTKKMRFVDYVEAGKSFVYAQEQLYDVKDFYKEYLDDEIGGTLVIKALTNDNVVTSILGDADINGTVDIDDVTLIQKYIAEIVPNMSEDQLKNADFNEDGVINIADATAIQKYLVNAL